MGSSRLQIVESHSTSLEISLQRESGHHPIPPATGTTALNPELVVHVGTHTSATHGWPLLSHHQPYLGLGALHVVDIDVLEAGIDTDGD